MSIISDALKYLVQLGTPPKPELFEFDGMKAAFVPERIKLQTWEETREKPKRIKASIGLLSVESFVAYYTRFAAPEKTMVFANEQERTIRAEFDAHEKDSPDWREHQCTLHLKPSLEFDKWSRYSGRFVNQKEFAEFLEDNLEDIVEPDGAAILEVATNLTNVKQTNFNSSVNLQNGMIGLQFVEKDTQTVEIPKVFKIKIPVFENGPTYTVGVRFRWKISEDNKLLLCFEIAKVDRIKKIAFADIVNDVAAQLNKAILRN